MLTRQELEDLNGRIKRVLGKRLQLNSSAEAITEMACQARYLAKTETAVALVIVGWTFAGGSKWLPMNFVTYAQFAQGIGEPTTDLGGGHKGVNAAVGHKISRALVGLEAKGIIHSICCGAGRPKWYHLSLVETILAEENRYREGSDDDELGAVLADLEAAERISSFEAMRDKERFASSRAVRINRMHRLREAGINDLGAGINDPDPAALTIPKPPLSRSSPVKLSKKEASPMSASDVRSLKEHLEVLARTGQAAG
jgi:hypothetical protein